MKDAALKAALKDGDPEAVDQLYRTHAARVLGWVIRLGGPRLDAEDVAQEVFIVALKTARRYRGDASVSTWLFGITRNVVANARRRAAIRSFMGLPDVPEPADRSPRSDEALASLRQRRRVQQALESLKTRQREVLVLVDLEGRTAPEAAALLGVPTGTVHSRLHHARRAFATLATRRGLRAELESSDGPIGLVLPLRGER